MTSKLKQNKFPISSKVFDSFRELSFEDKWNGIIGENTIAPGFMKWTRYKQLNNKNTIIIRSSV